MDRDSSHRNIEKELPEKAISLSSITALVWPVEITKNDILRNRQLFTVSK
jgi:hypothetical protein